VESPLDDAEVSSLETRLRFERALTFIRPLDLHQIFRGVDVESPLDDVEVSSLETRVSV
jgi:hypothetical protein